MLEALGGRRFAFTAKPTTIFVLGHRRPDYRADACLARFVRQQRPHNVSPSIQSVLARRRRREIAIEAASTTT
jgi:hypothetical protein